MPEIQRGLHAFKGIETVFKCYLVYSQTFTAFRPYLYLMGIIGYYCSVISYCPILNETTHFFLQRSNSLNIIGKIRKTETTVIVYNVVHLCN